MPNKVRIEVGARDDASKVFDAIRDKAEKVRQQGATGFGLGVGAVVGAKAMQMLGGAANWMTDQVGESIDAASNLNETMQKADVIFGQSSDAVEQWADKAATSFGMSKRAALDAASGFAGLFKTVGLSIDQSTQYGEKLTQLGSDLASFFNTDVDDALAALKSGLNGEAEPLRRFNVFLSETAVASKLAQMGIKKVGGQFTEAQKATARYALIMEQTGDAQGDFARTSDGLANTQRTLQGQLEDLHAEIGQKLLPVVRDLAIAFRDDILPAIEEAAKPGGSIDQLTGALSDLGNSFDPQPYYKAKTGLGEVDQSATSLFNSFVDLITFWDAKHEGVSVGLLEWADAADTVGSSWDHASTDMKDSWGPIDGTTGAVKNLGSTATETKRKVVSSFDAIVNAAKTTRTELSRIGSETADELYDPIILKADLAANRREQAEQRAIIANKNSTSAQVSDAKGRLAELQKSALGMELELIGYGKLNKKEQAALLRDLKKEWKSATGQAKADLAALIAYLESNFPTTVSIRADVAPSKKDPYWWKHRASGGPVYSGQTYLVGENGPELLTMSSGSAGNITPNASIGNVGGGSVMLNVTVNAAPGVTAGAAREIGAALGPAIYDWMKLRGFA